MLRQKLCKDTNKVLRESWDEFYLILFLEAMGRKCFVGEVYLGNEASESSFVCFDFLSPISAFRIYIFTINFQLK